MSRPRIIAGSAKGRVLDTPSRGTRPSPARLREALFNILMPFDKGAFLDLYSGSGAVGLEAASRGWDATCVEKNRAAAGVIRHNARTLELSVDVVQGDALSFAREHPQAFDVVFAAPPYPLELAPIFQQLLASDVAKAGGLYLFQHPTSLALRLELPEHTQPLSTRRYGSNALSLVRLRVAKTSGT